jgi:WD40 repeat protein
MDGRIKVWKLQAKHEKRINHVSFTPDGTRALTCSDDKTCRAFEVRTGTELTKIVGHTGSVKMCDMSPGATSWELHGLPRRGRLDTTDTCVVATASSDGFANVYNINTGLTMHKLHGHTKSVDRVVFSPDGRLLATGATDMCVCVWDAVTGERKHTLTGHTGDVTDIMFTKDNKVCVCVCVCVCFYA